MCDGLDDQDDVAGAAQVDVIPEPQEELMPGDVVTGCEANGM